MPGDLPPELAYAPELVSQLSRADWALGRVSSLTGLLANPQLLLAPMLRLEAVLSSRIEGTQTTPEELFRAEAVEAGPPEGDALEVLNYLRATELGMAALRQPFARLDLDLVRRLHGALFTGVGGRDRAPGRFREITVWVGRRGRPIEEATYVPPPWEAVVPLMESWQAYAADCLTTGRPRTPALVQCALLHAQFEMIHPFLDGNGRVGRLLMGLFLMARGLLEHPVLPLSAYLEQHREEYYACLLSISRDGGWEGWVRFFLRGVEQQALATEQAARAIVELRSACTQRLLESGASPSVFALLDRLFENPYTSARRAARQLGVHFQTAQRAIRLLQDLGFLEEVTGRRRGQQFRARDVLRAIEASAEPPSDNVYYVN